MIMRQKFPENTKNIHVLIANAIELSFVNGGAI